MKYVVDFETASICDLKKQGLYNYAAHPSTIITVLCFKPEGGKVYTIYQPGLGIDNTEEDIKAFTEFIDNPGKVVIAHNSPFEERIWEENMNQLTLSVLDRDCNKEPARYIDTSVLSAIFRGPASLEKAAQFFGIKDWKDTSGGTLMKKVSKLEQEQPKRATTVTLGIPTTWTKTAQGGYWARAGKEIMERLGEYCKQDVIVTSQLFDHFNKRETKADLGTFGRTVLEGAALTDRINKRGVKLDIALAANLEAQSLDLFEDLDQYCQDHFEVESHAKKVGMLKFIKSKGGDLTKLGKKDIEQFIEANPDFELNDALKHYSDHNKSSLKKYSTMLNLNKEGRLFNLFRYCGASATGRWASYGVNLQNLPRPQIEYDHIEDAMHDRYLHTQPEKLQSLIRACLIPSEGCQFFIADLKQIELRRTLDKCGYHKELNELAEGKDVYREMAAGMYKKKPEDITAEERQLGKEVMLSAQYGQGANKFKTQVKNNYGLDISIEEATKHINTYRTRFAKVTQMWQHYEAEIQKAYQTGKPLRIKLATGRYLNYGKLHLRTLKLPDGREKKNLTFFNGREYRGLWGGYVFQNVIQAESRDILMLKMLDFDSQAPIVMTVHDEVICEIDEGLNVDKLAAQWNQAGKEEINKYFPTLKLDSDCCILDRYFSH